MAGERILIVDDEADVLDLCKRILEAKAYPVKTALSGDEAITLARQEQFELLLTDIKMPGMSGLQIAQKLKQSDPGVICVIMTGFSTMDMVIEALKLGIDEFVMKPFAPEELSMAVAKALEKQHLRKENFRLRSLIPLFELNKTLMGTVEVEQVLSSLLEISQKETNADLAGLYLFNNDEAKIIFHRGCNPKTARQQAASDKLARFVLDNDGQQLILNARDRNYGPYATLLEQLEAQSIIVTPLKSKEANLGALVLGRRQEDFDPSDVDFLAVLSGQAGIALENARLFSEIQAAYKEVKMLDHMKSEFINIAAHELRTPLAILMGYAAVLEDDLEGAAQQYVSHIMRNALRLRSIIDDMLSLQSLDSGTASLSTDPLNLAEVVNEITHNAGLLVSEKNLSVQINIPGDFPHMITDRQKFELIFMNLFHNAVKFTPQGGQIIFKATTTGSWAIMSLTNTGVSIPREKLKRIFDRFYQVENSLTREHGGIGLGLAIVRGMVEVCGGSIRAESSEESGTTFTFTLPLDNTHLKDRVLKGA